MITVTSPEDFERGLFGEKSLSSKDSLHGEDDLGAEGVLHGAFILYKEWGQTPLETLEAYRQTLLEKCQTDDLATLRKRLVEMPMTYAGRLDPVAEGALLVLVGDETKNKDQYLGLDKEYEIEVLLGLKTDSGDIFGVLENETKESENFAEEKIKEIVQSFKGKHLFEYPVYSSKTVQGKPLFQWKNEGRIGEIEIPKKNIEIYNIDLHDVYEISIKEVSKKVQEALEKVHGDFRFKEIAESWKIFQQKNLGCNFKVLKITCQCSSGTYMRVLAEKIGEKLDASALAYSIKRTKFIFS